MYMRMEGHLLGPCMVDQYGSDLSINTLLGIFTKCLECIFYTSHEYSVERPFIILEVWIQLTRHREHTVKILHWQQVLLSLYDPLFLIDTLTRWAVSIAAAVVMNLVVAAVIASLFMSTECRSLTNTHQFEY